MSNPKAVRPIISKDVRDSQFATSMVALSVFFSSADCGEEEMKASHLYLSSSAFPNISGVRALMECVLKAGEMSLRCRCLSGRS